VSVPLGVRPRSEVDRIAMCRVLAAAPARVGLAWTDDGWVAAHLALAGRRVVWRDGVPGRRAVDGVLTRLGLPCTEDGDVDAWLDEGLSLRRGIADATTWSGPPGAVPLPPHGGPLTSILVCTYNRAHLIGEALASARAQTRAREIVVVNDGSDDGTAELLDALDGIDGIRVIHQENTGKPGALARALEEARGEYVLVLDDDDVLLPGALHALGAVLDSSPDAAAVFGDTAVARDTMDAIVGHRPAVRLPPSLLPAATLMQVPCMPGACLIRRSAHDAAGPYDPSLVRGQDMDLFLRLARVGPLVGVPLTTFVWREHGGVRGRAGDQWARRDRAEHDRRFKAQVAPVFRRRWTELRTRDRLMGHAWAVGLALRGLHAEAAQELKRWKPPCTPTEAGLREKAGARRVKVRRPKQSLVVVDDGDAGALEAVLAREGAGRRVHVDLEVHREPLSFVQLFWPGEYRAQELPGSWLVPGAHVRLSSAPDWRPPVLTQRAELPPLPAPSGLLALAAVLDWDLPQRTRPGLRWTPHPVAEALWTARRALRAGDGGAAIAAVLPVCEALPAWGGAWALAGDAFSLLGLEDDAAVCRSRAHAA